MIISRTVARKRIAAGIRPSFRAAWLPVLADAACVTLLLALLWPTLRRLVEAGDIALWAGIALLLAVVYVPFQIVVTLSTIWAVKSRWDDGQGGEKGA